MLPRLRVIQVGDIHLVRTAKTERHLDDKDPRFPSGVRNLMAGSPIKTVFRTLHRLIEQEPIASLLFMGDFAEKGDLPGFEACVRYLAEALQIGSGRRLSALQVGFISGNHDISRDLAAKPGLRTKFLPLQKAMAELGLPSLPIEQPIWLNTTEGNSRIDIALLNSCWGCGAKEFIPEEFRTEISNAINTAISQGLDERATTAYYDRQLDTPAFSNNTVQYLIDAVPKLPGSSLILACAHHNLLPQHMPRLAPYTELVNSGVVRRALLALERPVLYLHGHIHDDPVEIIQTPTGGPLVCISAPEASEGFNVLELVFTQSGLPLTCYLRPWRFDGGVFHERTRRVIPISGSRRKPSDPSLSAIYQKIVAERDCYWHALVGCAKTVGAPEPDGATEEALETLVSDQLITIENYDLDREHWIIRSRL
ncbi:hypothetical protein B5U98_27820 [Bosea sp. Tri-39]|nr:hypothetical protein BLM15_29590 [Bosea sp. Tri-49]RXT16727.1 hypothetical protein B5U98_27820 [Bosea sp. Tri-39]RXT42352.1 hypothetical protein B5U99_00100 [Bosea sp. Tri-54]